MWGLFAFARWTRLLLKALIEIMPADSDTITLLKVKFDHIVQECENETRAQIDSIYSDIKYQNGRLNVPDFQKVAKVIVGVIRLKEKGFISEISRISMITHGGFKAEWTFPKKSDADYI